MEPDALAPDTAEPWLHDSEQRKNETCPTWADVEPWNQDCLSPIAYVCVSQSIATHNEK